MKTIVHRYTLGNAGYIEIPEDDRGRLGDVEVSITGITSLRLNIGRFKQFVYDLCVIRDFIAERTRK